MRSFTLAALAFAASLPGTPAASAQSAPAYGDPVTFAPGGSDQIGVTRLDDNRFVVAYRRDEGRTRVGSIAGDGVVTLGSEFVFDGAFDEQEIHIEALDDSRFVIAYRRLDEVYAVVGEVNGLDVTYGPLTSLEAPCYSGVDIDVLDSDRFVVAYSEEGPGRARICSVAGTTISLGPVATFESSLVYLPQVAALEDSLFAVAFTSSSGGFVRLGKATGTSTVTLGPALPLAGPPSSIDALDGARFLIAMLTAEGGLLAVGEGAAQLVASLGPETTYVPEPDLVESHAYLEALTPDRFVVTWYDGLIDDFSGCLYGTCRYRSRKGVVSGDTVSSLSEVVNASSTSGKTGGSFNLDHAQVGANDAFVIAFTAPGTSEPLVRRSAADGVCGIRNGTGANPVGYTCLSAPIGGETWLASVDDTPSVGVVTAATVIGFGLGGGTTGAFLPAGELLVLPPYAQDIALGAHSLPLGPSVPIGITIPSQAARIEVTPAGDFGVVLLNGLDLFIGG